MREPVYWITTDLPDFCTCGICGAVVWQLGEGVELHKKWHKGGFVVDMLFDEQTDSDGQPWT